MSERTPPSRDAILARIGDEPWDVLVVGGGIVGAGVARDAAQRGLRVALVDAADFASGTSSRSSRLLHGGLRYLAQGRVGLVREANHEKHILSRIAPHLVQPLPFLFPSYRGGWPLWQLRIGVRAYDWLCRGGANFAPSRSLSASEVLQETPGLKSERLKGGVRYFDALTSDARLVLDTLRSAARHHAAVVNYLAFDRAERAGDSWRCELRDARSGQTVHARARTIVNAAGPWASAWPQSSVSLRLTKGVHLVVPREKLPITAAVVMTRGARIVFGIPWGCHTVLGTTDTDYDTDPRQVATERGDVDYLLDVVNEYFPRAALEASDVTSTWAGVRPLIAAGGRPSDISRSHEIRWAQPGWLDVAGGKLTTYRLMAEQAVDRLLAFLGRPRFPCRTADEPLLPDGAERAFTGVLPPAVSRQAVEHYCRAEWACCLEDVMIRRTSWHYDLSSREPIAAQIARWMASVLGWDEQRQQRELQAYVGLIERENAWRPHEVAARLGTELPGSS